jgi:tRNA threonylcarbamoyladenosine biosynthesis protein TsaE
MTSIENEILTHSTEETEAFGASLAEAIAEDSSLPRFIALYGDLGVGKTAFVRGFTSVFAKSARVKSPTFALVNEYRGDTLSVFHFDMYRIEDEDELYSIGFYDYQDRNGICLTEWSENIEYALPERYFSVKIEKCEGNTELRKISTELIGKN